MSRLAMGSAFKPNPRNLRLWQAGLLIAVFGLWHVLTTPGLVPPFMFENDRQAAFFFGEPLKIFSVWFGRASRARWHSA